MVGDHDKRIEPAGRQAVARELGATDRTLQRRIPEHRAAIAGEHGLDDAAAQTARAVVEQQMQED